MLVEVKGIKLEVDGLVVDVPGVGEGYYAKVVDKRSTDDVRSIAGEMLFGKKILAVETFCTFHQNPGSPIALYFNFKNRRS